MTINKSQRSRFAFELTAKAAEFGFHMETPWDSGTNIYTIGFGHMPMMANMLKYDKGPSKVFSASERS